MKVDVFFFQAEDGIRDLVRSRGLGDVYKRQPWCVTIDHESLENRTVTVRDRDSLTQDRVAIDEPVSYTHLTLPTIYSA